MQPAAAERPRLTANTPPRQPPAVSADFKILFLGSGTSAGVPMIACDCPVCTSPNPRDRRLRSSVYISAGGLKILVDTSPDFREQALRHDIRRIDHLLVTHAHVDHLFGLDDVRRVNTVQGAPIPLYAAPETLADIRRIFDYIFHDAVPGTFRPKLLMNAVSGPFSLKAPDGGEVSVTPVDSIHGWTRTLGYIFEYAGRRFGYVPDCHELPAASRDAMGGLDLLAIDCLKRRPHPTHLSLAEALAIVGDLRPRRVLLTHIGHDFGHDALSREVLGRGFDNVSPAFDGLLFDMAREFAE